ncbi:MAG TPA: hypothetical protein VLH60_04350 [Sedimentisphaerales bacterium]|nr:hypothetical protein [Sedimentisphaerales bacterium]
MDKIDACRFSAPAGDFYVKISPCTLCPRNCRAERLAASARIASLSPAVIR